MGRSAEGCEFNVQFQFRILSVKDFHTHLHFMITRSNLTDHFSYNLKFLFFSPFSLPNLIPKHKIYSSFVGEKQVYVIFDSLDSIIQEKYIEILKNVFVTSF